MQKVEVRSSLPVDGVQVQVIDSAVVLSKDSPYRFVTIKPALINDENLKDYIETLLESPTLEVTPAP